MNACNSLPFCASYICSVPRQDISNRLPPFSAIHLLSFQAVSNGIVWGMDRATFRRIILAARIKRREKFEETLQEMPIFAALTASQRASIADCLELEIFEV